MMPGTVSVRMLWPFLRVVQDFAPELDVLRAAGVDPESLSNPDERIPRPLFARIIRGLGDRTRDDALGVHAGERIESGDFGVMDLAVRACPDIRSAIHCITRYVRLQDDSIEMSLTEDGDRVLWQCRNVVAPLVRTTNDFQVTATVFNVLRRLGRSEAPIEVHVRHDSPTDAGEYARVFRAPVRYGMPHNGVVLSRSLLSERVPFANPEAHAIFDLRAKRMLEQLALEDAITGKVRRLVANRIGREGISITQIGAQLHVSEATLRRRLVEEGTTYKNIVDVLRQELALHYIGKRGVAISEIAFLLGFSTQAAFGRAFRRWTGGSPLDYRRRING